MLKIGVFANMAQVSVKCLRHYDDIGLLRPIEVDNRSGYRYYTAEQLPRLHRILALKELGFSLEEIHQLIDVPLTSGQLREMLRSRRSELEERVREEQERLMRVEAHLKLMETQDAPHYDVMLKKVPSQIVAALSLDLDNATGRRMPLVDLFAEGRAFLKAGQTPQSGPEFSLSRQKTNGELAWVEAVFPLSAPQAPLPLAPTRRVQVYELSGAVVASTIHRGLHATSWQAGVATLRWMEANCYRQAGPRRSIYHLCDKSDQTDSIVEVQIPVVKTDVKQKPQWN